MKFLVTGGAGFIGSNITRALLEKGHLVRVLDNLHAGSLRRLSDSVEFVKADIRDDHALDVCMRGCDGVFHEAALVSVPESYIHESAYHDVNVNGTKNVLKHAEKHSLKVVYASSSSVYGNPKSIPIREDTPCSPENPYGSTKVDAEIVVQEHIEMGTSVIALRYFNVYGAGQTGTYAGVITQFMKKLKAGHPPMINGDGSQSRDFIHVRDVASANLAAMCSDVHSGFFNIGTGKSTTINELVSYMIHHYSLNLEPTYCAQQPGDVPYSEADIAQTARAIPWKYSIKLEDGLSSIL